MVITLRLALLVVFVFAGSVGAQDVLLLGSSSTCGPLGVYVRGELRERGYRLLPSVCHHSSGLARPDAFDWMENLPLQLTGVRVIVFLGGNDAQSLRVRTRRTWGWLRWSDEGDWRELYAERTRELVDVLCERGATRVIMIAPPPVAREHLELRLPRVRSAMLVGVDRSRCGVFVDTSRLAFDPRTAYLADDAHLSRSGAAVAWDSLGARLLELLVTGLVP